MSALNHEVLRFPAGVPIVQGEAIRDDGSLLIKGFASVEVVDRSQDLVSPEEFNIQQFMTAPTLLVNHKYWRDYAGNEVAVGRPETLNAVKLAKSANVEVWDLVDTVTKKVVNTFPKSKIPELKVGDKGLFITAVVTEPDVAQRVTRGELAAFSWRGLAAVDYVVNKETNMTQKTYRDIDLYEISLVNIPDQPLSVLMVGKDGESSPLDTPLVVSSLRLDKTRFENTQMVAEYLKAHNLDMQNVREDGHSFCALQKEHSKFDLGKLVTVNLAPGVVVVAGPLKDSIGVTGEVASPLGKNDVEKLISLFKSPTEGGLVQKKESTMADTSKKDQSGDLTDEQKVEAAKKKELEREETAKKKKEEQETAVSGLGDVIAAKTVAGLTPVLESIGKSIAEFGEVVKKALPEKKDETIVKDKSDEVTGKTDTAKSVEGMYDALNTIAEGILDTQKQVVEVAKGLDAVKQTTPQSDDHASDAEITGKEDVSKGGGGDPNAVLDSVFPFLS